MSHENSTVLTLGGRGKHRGAPFALTGRTCVRSDGGAIWNEWTARFDDGRVGFLAEARGSFTLFFERPIAPLEISLGEGPIGRSLDTGFIVVERGKGTRVATWGDVPDVPRAYRYADLSSRTGESATIDYSRPKEPRTFVGTKVTLEALALKPRHERPRFVPVRKAALPKGFTPALAIGDEATMGKARFRVIGSLQRSIKIEGKRYTWEEHLLHDISHGFRWLALSDDKWNLIESVEPGLVRHDDRSATLDGGKYRFFSGGTARVEWAGGEMPWEVAIGDTARVRDYTSGTHTLSYEETDDEIAWSRGSFVASDKIRRTFVKRATRTSGELEGARLRAPSNTRRRSANHGGDEMVQYEALGKTLIAALAFSGVGILLFAIAFFIIVKVTPFSLRKEIEEDQNTSLAIIIASVILGIALIVSSAIHS